MPHILLAGIVKATKTDLFPARGRPRCEVQLEVIDAAGDAAIYRVVAHDEVMPELATLAPGTRARSLAA